MNKIKVKTYSIETPLSEPQFINFNEADVRRSTLLMLGLDPSLTDEELKEYKSAFAPTLLDLSKMDEEEAIPVLDIINKEIKEKKIYIDELNKEIQDDFDNKKTYTSLGSVTIGKEDDEEKIIKYIENKSGFAGWLDEFYLYDNVAASPSLSGSTTISYYKIDGIYVQVPNILEHMVEELMKLSDNSFEEVFDVSNVLMIYSVYDFIEMKTKTSNKGDNTANRLVDMIVDREQTKIDNKNLVPDGEFPDFFSKDTVENFSEESVFDKFNDIFN